MLLRRDVLTAAGGLAAIRSAIIDDVNLARAVAPHGRLRLAASRSDVVSLRRYDTVGAIWRMVRRTAFDELRYSWTLLAVTVVGLVLLFAGPPAAVAAGVVAGEPLLVAIGAAAWALQAGLYLPAVRSFRLTPAWALALPLAGVLYGAMTVDSALRHARGRGGAW